MQFLVLLCAGLIGLIFATAVTFGGYRLFLVLLPIWGFIFGFGLGAQTVQALFGEGFLATTTSWVVGLLVAIVFAVLSYLFWFFAVAIFSASAGYALGYGVMSAITPSATLINWIVGIVVALIVAFIVLRFNLQKWAIIVISAFLGAGMMVGVLLGVTSGAQEDALVENPVVYTINNNPLWFLFWVVVGAAGVYVQWRANRTYTIAEYNRLTTVEVVQN
jgi:hypothetical protein